MTMQSTNRAKRNGAAPASFDVTDLPTANRPFNDDKTLDGVTSRLDAVAKVTGKARYSRDIYPTRTLFVQGIRCPWGKAKITKVDVSAAKAVPGVVEVTLDGAGEGDYHGDWMGHIAAESRVALRRGLKALAIQWERLPCKTGIDPAIVTLAEPAEKEAAAIAKADHVLEADYSTPVQTHSALETHGMVVDHDGSKATVFASTQGTFAVAEEVARFIGLGRSAFEVHCEYVGGGFGAKFQIGNEGKHAATVAAAMKRPAYSFCDRKEEHLDTGNRPSSHVKVKVGFATDGTILGGQVHVFGGVGVAKGGGGAAVPSGRYRLGDIAAQTTNVSFNGGAPRAMRAPGHPQGAFVEELMLDEIATIAGVDPLALRRRLDTDETGFRRGMYDAGAAMIGWERRQPTGSQTGVIRRGFGVGTTSWRALRGPAKVDLLVHRDGSITLRSGSQDIGTGFKTIIGVTAATELGVPLSALTVQIASSTLPEGPASGGSVTTPSVNPAVIAAARDARAKLLDVAAKQLAVDAKELSIVGGEIRRGGATAMTWNELCRILPTETIVGNGSFDGGKGEHFGEGNSHGVQFVELEVDAETGVIALKRVIAFQACGKILCRKTAESQVIGGVIQGASYALFEDKILDRWTGAMVNPNLEMYKILGPNDMPLIEPVLWSDASQTGARGLGEPPVVPTAGAIACAVFNAIGAPVRHLPLTPDKVLAAIGQASAVKTGGAA